MDLKGIAEESTPERIAVAVRKNMEALPEPHHQGGTGMEGMESVREATYKGHQIVVRTTYRLEVDGIPVTGHVGATNAGYVHYHGVPNQQFRSAIDLVKRLIDLFPADIARPGAPSETAPPGSHEHHME